MNVDNIAQLVISGMPDGAAILYVDNIYFSNENCNDSGNSSEYCEREVSHFGFGNPAESGLLTISNVNANTIEVLVKSTDDNDPIDYLEIIGSHGGVQSAVTEPETGVFRRTLTWVNPPTDVSLNVLFSRMNQAGNSQISMTEIIVPFEANCGGDPIPTTPVDPAPEPPCAAEEVISMFSEIYSDVRVDTWRTGWSSAGYSLENIGGDDVHLYTNLSFVGIETVGPNLIDATSMNSFNLDIWTPNMTNIRIKLVDFGGDQAFGGGDDTEHEITIPNLPQSQWVSLRIPLSAFVNLAARNNIAQFILAGDGGSSMVYVDNVYFATNICNEMPILPAPTPDCESEDVISLFSNSYSDVPVDDFLTFWSAATLMDVAVDGNDIKKYDDVNFLGIETVGPNSLDISDMLHVNIDIWTPNMTQFRIKLVDFGADNAFAGGDDVEHEITIDNPTQREWIKLKIPIADFTGLTTKEHLSQIVLAGMPAGTGTLFVDNLYFSGPGCSDVPLEPAPTPDCPAEDVISMFSDEYSDVTVDTWRTVWSSGDFMDITVDGNPTKQYTNLDFVGIETVGPNLLDVSGMEYLSLDVWTPNMTTLRVKLVDFGADQAFGGGDDSEHEVVYQVIERREWVTLCLSLDAMNGLNARDNIAQLIISGLPTGQGTVFIDNIFFSTCSKNDIPECPELVWEDEFDGTELNTAYWNYQIGDGCDIGLCGWGNNEQEYYREENTEVSGGTLKITAKQESFGGRPYTSSRINTKGKVDFTYGRVEASIKLPIGQGMWPAFWMLSTEEVYGIWPQSGEIDIMENIGSEPERIFGTIHYGQLFPNNSFIGTNYDKYDGHFNDDFHEFAIEWEEDEIRWYVDDYLYATKTPADIGGEFWPFDQDFHILLNLAVGGTLPGNPDGTTMFPQVMEVDYVRVYKGTFAHLAGNRFVTNQAQGEVYSIENSKDGSTYTWTVPDGAEIVSGQGTNSITVNWGDVDSGGEVTVSEDNSCDNNVLKMVVTVDKFRVNEFECAFENFDDEALITQVFANGTYVDNTTNPDPNEINSSALVGKYTRNAGSEFDVIVYTTAAIPDASEFVEKDKTFYLDVYTPTAPIGTEIIIQLENSSMALPENFPTGRHSRYRAYTTTQNEWERLAFEFVDRPDGTVPDNSIDVIIVLFDPANTSGDMYFIDNFDKYCTDSPDNCFEDMDISLSDPCNCENPENLVVNGYYLYHDVLRVDASSLNNPVVSMLSQDGNMLDENGDPIDPGSANWVNEGGGIYTLEFYSRINAPATVTIAANDVVKTFTTSSCRVCPNDLNPLPVMNKWRLFGIGALLILMSFFSLRRLQILR